MKYYFAYGSNLSEEQMKKRCPDSKLIGKAVLKGYKLDFTIFSSRWNGGAADIVQDANNEVWGLIYELNDEDIDKLDKCEGHPKFYRRITKKVINESKEEIEVQIYEVVNKKSFIKPSEEYFSIIINAAKKFEFPEDYIEYLEGEINVCFLS